MKTRGRPRHPDILTPRQWEVFEYLQRGLTNEEIAQRMGITLDGAKFHVSEILGRLGLASRYEAASWRPEPQPTRRRWAFAFAPFALLRNGRWSAVAYALAAIVAVAAASGVALLAWGVVKSAPGGGGPVRIGAVNPRHIIFTTLKAGEGTGLHERWTVSVYDTTTGQVVHSFGIGDGMDEQPAQVVAAGNKLVANLTNRIVRYDMDGSHAAELRHAREGGRILSIAASPDGKRIALSEQIGALCPTASASALSPTATPIQCSPYAPMTTVSVIGTATGREVMSVAQAAPGFAGFRGQAYVLTWRDDGLGFVVGGLTYSEAPGSIATVMLDGGVKTYTNEPFVSLSPNGRFAATGAYRICSLGTPIEQHEIVVRRLDDSAVVARVGDSVLNFTAREWSPDGSELLYHTSLLVPPASSDRCKVEDPATVRWYLLRIDGAPPIPVADVAAARHGWYGARTIEYRCGNRPVLEPSCSNPNGTVAPVGVYVGGRQIATAQGGDFRIVQFVPPATPPAPATR